MSWSIEEHIGEGRPWPEQVVVYRGETDESLTYARRSLSDMNKMAELMDALATENAKLRKTLSDLWGLFTENAAVHACDLPVVDAVRDRMHELGVEVDV